MRLVQLAIACVLPLVWAQDRSTSTATSSVSAAPSNASSQANITVITTTITSLVSQGTASPSPTSIVLTLTINSTSLASSSAANISSLANSTSTIANNGTSTNSSAANATAVWKEGDDWIPFTIVIDPAYGVLGALLIITGIPVAVLGGKNRWSSLAIASGYTLMVFTLVLILRFGVQPNIQPPSPQPPSTTLRGLYLLACIISAVIGGGIGIFLWKFAKYWVSAAGGFAFGWFLLALRPGGTITNVIGRWGLLGGLTVAAFVASLPEKLNPWMILLGTSWIGATAFMLGVDCYARSGLKEFYVYNLGFWDLFPKLEGAQYPLTQMMSIELGIMAAVVVIGSAIQFRILNILQKRIKQLKDEEEAREDAAEVQKAAERFKNLGSEQAEWEEKYGSSSGGASSPGYGLDTPGLGVVPSLDFADPRRASSQLSLLSGVEKGKYETRSLHSIGEVQRGAASPATGNDESEVIKEDDVMENKLRLLEEVRQARMSIRSSLDNLRSHTPALSTAGREAASLSSTPTSSHFGQHVRTLSGTSSRLLDGARTPVDATPAQPGRRLSEWERYTSERQILSPTLISPVMPSGPAQEMSRLSSQQSYGPDSRERVHSMLESKVSDFGPLPHHRQSNDDTHPLREPLRCTESANGNIAMTRPASHYDLARPTSQYAYEAATAPNRSSGYSTYGQVTGSAALGAVRASDSQQNRLSGMQRTMTYEELSDRHRKRITKLQDPVSSKMNEELALAQAKEKWERQKRQEKAEMIKREAEKVQWQKEREREAADGSARPNLIGGPAVGREEGLRKAEQWRRSVHTGLDSMAAGSGQRVSEQYGSRGTVRGSGIGPRRMSSHMAN